MAPEVMQPRPQPAIGSTPYHQWRLPGEVVSTAFYRTPAGYLVRFPALADFEISTDSLAVTCHPAPDVDEETWTNLYLNQVWPLVQSKRGALVFHGSAVEIEGSAAAFLAPSGRGKSTLAASFAMAGYRFLTDDGLLLEPAKDGYVALPSHPSIRLWPDSREALIGAQGIAESGSRHKTRHMAESELAHCAEARPLRLVCFLGDGTSTELRVRRMSPSDVLVEWCRNSFLLDPLERPMLASHFDRLAALANRLPCYRLDYPRRFEALGAVRQAVVEMHLADGSSR